MDKIKPITLEIENKVWQDWKLTIPRDKTLNEALVALVNADLVKKQR